VPPPAKKTGLLAEQEKLEGLWRTRTVDPTIPHLTFFDSDPARPT
jgi:hypothetical protein